MEKLNQLQALKTALNEGSLSVESVVEAALQRAEETASLNIFIALHRERVRARACELDAQHDPQREALWGIPVAVKDNFDEGGVVCSVGSRAYAQRVPEADAAVVARLRQAGALILGRTNMHELADGVTSENPHYGPVKHPLRPGHHPGGSSGGSAVAVATGCVPVALGTDTGGSVRIPASLCGVVGFKPTRGLVPTQGVFPLSTTLDHVGPLTASVGAAREIFQVLCPPSEPRATSLGSRDDPLHIGVLEGFGLDPEPEVQELMKNAVAVIEEMGHTVTSAPLPLLARGVSILAGIYGPEAARAHAERLAEAPHLFGDEARANLERGARRSEEKYQASLDRGQALAAALTAQAPGPNQEQNRRGFDLLISPTTPYPARPFGSPAPHEYLTYTCPFNISGQPALSVPMGLVQGLPVGLQIAGPLFHDHQVLELGAAFERVLGLSREDTNKHK